MNLHLKLFLPTSLALAAIAATMHFYWLPNYLALEKEDRLNSELTYINLLGTALVPDLLNNDFAKIHSTLQRVLENQEYWHVIKLFDQDQQLIYPLIEQEPPGNTDMELLNHSISYNGNTLAHFMVWIDIKSSSAQRVAHIQHLETVAHICIIGCSPDFRLAAEQVD